MLSWHQFRCAAIPPAPTPAAQACRTDWVVFSFRLRRGHPGTHGPPTPSPEGTAVYPATIRRRPSRSAPGVRRGHRPGRHEHWPAGTSADPRKEHTPHPARKLNFNTDSSTKPRQPTNSRHHHTPNPVSFPVNSRWSLLPTRQHARWRTGSANPRATGLRNLPCHPSADSNVPVLESSWHQPSGWPVRN